jgi:hypothetical protein
MARPRIFINSTFYDLHHVRDDLERFVLELGYDPIRHETGSIPYGKEKPPESYAYQEVELSDIIVTIIGGRFGTESRENTDFSIAQNELRRALDRNVQVFIFVEQGVLSEFSTYKLNKDNKKTKYRFVDDVRIYDFLEKPYNLPANNPITGFQTTKDITEYLRAQWAGLFQRFLREQNRLSEIQVLDEVKTVASTLQQLVEFLTKERQNRDTAIQSILLSNHPAFRRFASVTKTPYRVFFTTLSELNTWLKARSWKPVDKDAYDDNSVLEWYAGKDYIKLTEPIFEKTGRLKNYSDEDWKDEWVQRLPIPSEKEEDENEIPF